jgi:hypothetical protein
MKSISLQMVSSEIHSSEEYPFDDTGLFVDLFEHKMGIVSFVSFHSRKI